MIQHLLAAVLAATVATSAVAGTPSEADIATVEQFLAKDNSYTPEAKAEARRRALQLAQYLKDQPRFELEVARIVALADNGHTALFPAQWTTRYARSPVRVGLFADGLFVIAAPAKHASAIGKPVATINGMPWRDVRRAFSAYQGGNEALKDQYFSYFAETPLLLTAAGIGSDTARLSLTLVDGPALLVEAEKAPLEGEAAFLGQPMLRDAINLIQGSVPLYLRDSEKLYSFVELRDLNAVYIRLDAIGGANLEEFLDQSLQRLRSGNQRNIMLDLRFNMGGDLTRARDFAKALPGLAKGGRVYVITSGRTFSAAISTTGYLKQADPTKVRIVGDPVGDRLEFWAEGRTMTLPGLGAELLPATERHNYRTGCPEADCHRWVRDFPIRVDSLDPDLSTPLRFADFVGGRDPAMEAIAKDIRSQR